MTVITYLDKLKDKEDKDEAFDQASWATGSSSEKTYFITNYTHAKDKKSDAVDRAALDILDSVLLSAERFIRIRKQREKNKMERDVVAGGNRERMSGLRDKMEKDHALALREGKGRALNEDGAQRMRLEKQRREREENARRLKEEEAFLQLKLELMMYDFHIRPRISKESFTGLQVDDVDLIRIALIGPTGSGKTSFIGKYKFYLFESTINCFQMLSSRMANIIGLVQTLVGFYHH